MKLIAAADKNWAIGKDGELLVRISEDMKNFSAITTGNRNIHLFRGSVEITRSNQSSIKEGKRPFNPNI